MPMTRTLLAAALAALACAPRPAGHRPEAAATSAGGPGQPAPWLVNGETAAVLARAGARVIDVRTPQEYEAGHVPGALNIPFDEIRQRASEVGAADAPVVLYCRSGRRSAIAAEGLRGLGFTRVYDAQRQW